MKNASFPSNVICFSSLEVTLFLLQGPSVRHFPCTVCFKKKVSRILKKTGSPIFDFFDLHHMHSQMACETHPRSGIASSEWLHCGPPLWCACATVPCNANLARKSGNSPIYCLGQFSEIPQGETRFWHVSTVLHDLPCR